MPKIVAWEAIQRLKSILFTLERRKKTKLHNLYFIVWNTYKCGGRVIYVVGDLKMWWKIDTINVAGEVFYKRC